MRHKNLKVSEYVKELIDVFYQLPKDKEVIFSFLKDILTPNEFEALAFRWQIIKKLNKKEDHRKIAGELGLGLGTVARGSRMLRNKKGGFHLMLKKTNN